MHGGLSRSGFYALNNSDPFHEHFTESEEAGNSVVENAFIMPPMLIRRWGVAWIFWQMMRAGQLGRGGCAMVSFMI